MGQSATRISRLLVVALPAASLTAVGSTSAMAALPTTITVNTLLDLPDISLADGICSTAMGTCSLRAAIQEVNAAGDTSYRTIVLPPGTFTLTRRGAFESAAKTGDLDVTANGSLAIDGAGAGLTVIDGGGIDRVFDLRPPASVGYTIKDLTVRNGFAWFSDGGGITTAGAGNVAFMAVDVVDNRATFSGGGINLGHTGTSGAFSDGRITGNQAGFDGGGIRATRAVGVSRSTVADNTAGLAGGGMHTSGATTGITRSTLSGNEAGTDGGGAYVQAGALTIIESTIAANAADGTGGGLTADTGTASISESTLALNAAAAGNGGMALASGASTATFDLVSTIVADNDGSVDDCPVHPGSTFDRSVTTGCVGDSPAPGLTKVLAGRLRPLGDNGGDTETVLPEPDFGGVDLFDGCGTFENDQRGQARGRAPFGTATPCDVGAVEVQVAAVAVDLFTDVDPGAPYCTPAPADCRLRDAVEFGPVSLSAGTYELLDTITIADVTDVIAGAGMRDTIIDATLAGGRAFLVSDGFGGIDATFRDLTIRGGSVDATDLTQAFLDAGHVGGAIAAEGNGLTVERVRFEGNSAPDGGGAVFYRSDLANAVFEGSEFEDNTTEGDGGALDLETESSATGVVEDTIFDGNEADGFGGAIHCVECNLTVEDSEFVDNHAVEGGAIFCDLGTWRCRVDVENSLFQSNRADLEGGAIASSTTPTSTAAALSVTNSTFAFNQAGTDGGAVEARNAAGTFAGSGFSFNTLVGNTAAGVGGGIHVGSSPNLTIQQNVFTGNTATGDGDHCWTDVALAEGANWSDTADATCTSATPVDPTNLLTPLGALGLGPLQDNGGARSTYLPTPTSVLRGLATDDCALALTDARGGARSPVTPDGCDPGAAELPELQATLTALISSAASPSTIRLANLPPEAYASLASSVVDEAGLGATPMADIDIAASPMADIPMADIPMADITLNDLPLAALVIASVSLIDIPIRQGWEPILEGSGLDGIPLQVLTMADVFGDAAANSNLAAVPMADIDLGATPMADIPMAALALGALPMADIPLEPADAGNDAAVLADWCDFLQTVGFACGPDLGITPADPSSAEGWTLMALALAGVPMADIPMADIPMADIDISGTPMADIPMADIAVGTTPMADIPMADIDISGTPMADIPLAALPLSAIPLSASPMADIPMADIAVGSTPMADIPMADISVAERDRLVDCTLVDCASATLGDAFLASAIRADATLGMVGDALVGLRLSDVIGAMSGASLVAALAAISNPEGRLADLTPYDSLTLGELFEYGEITLGEFLALLPLSLLEELLLNEVLAALFPPTDYPWENLDLDAFAPATFADDAIPIPYTLDLAASDPLAPWDVDVTVTLPDGFVYKADSTTSTTTEIPEPTIVGQELRWDLNGLASPMLPTQIAFRAFPSLESGPGDATVSATLTDYLTTSTSNAIVRVTESLEPNDTVPTATDARPDTLYITQIQDRLDVDYFSIDVEAGDELSVILSNLPADYDLVLYAPPVDPLRDAPSQYEVPMDDEGVNLLRPTAAEPEPLDDILLSSPDIYGTSARRGLDDERIDTPPLPRSGTYTVQVTGYNGAFSPEPYTLRMATQAGPELPPCDPLFPPFDGEGTVGALPGALPAGLDTLILVNQERLGDMYGAAQASDVMTKLDEFVTTGSGMTGVVYPIDADVDVATAYDDWAVDRCNPDLANDVVREIGVIVSSVRDARPSLENIVIVGGDDQIPFGRVPDRTSLANETGYHQTFSTNNELVGALGRGFLLSDEPYGDADPLGLGSRQLFVTDLALGRLVESPADIIDQLDHYLLFDGLLDAATGTTAHVSGYDFLDDGADLVSANLAEPPNYNSTIRRAVDDLIERSEIDGDEWDRADQVSALADGPTIASINAHFDHYRSLPALGNATGSEDDLFELDDLSGIPLEAPDAGHTPEPGGAHVLDGAILFSMGCHSGLSVSDVQIGLSATPQDWAETITGEGVSAAVYAANSGFGYGDTEVVALSEALMAEFAGRLDGTTTVGTAFAHAKQAYAGEMGANGPYDEKVLMEATFYGLPMYRVASPAEPAAPLNFPAEAGPLPTDVLVADGADADTQPDLEVAKFGGGVEILQAAPAGDRGSYYFYGDNCPGNTTFGSCAGHPNTVQVTHLRPIQPAGSFDLSQPDGSGGLRVEARGAQLTGLYSWSDVTDFDPVIARPSVDRALNEPEPFSSEVIFPSKFQKLRQLEGPQGTRDQLVFTFGQFQGGVAEDGPSPKVTGTQRLFPGFDVDIFYGSVETTDRQPPYLRQIAAYGVGGSTVEFRVEALDPSGILNSANPDVHEANVLYIEQGETGDWNELELQPQGGDVWSAQANIIASEIEYMVQVVDAVGNVAVSTNKGGFHGLVDTPPDLQPAAPQMEFRFDGGAPSGRWFGSDVSVTLVNAPGGTTYSVDNSAFATYTGAFNVTEAGEHIVIARPGDGGDDLSTMVRIDGTAPTVTFVNPDPTPGAANEYYQDNAPLATVVCDDVDSGVAVCEAEQMDDSTIGGPFTLTATAVDFAGNQTQATVDYSIVESLIVAPEPDPDPDPDPGPGPAPTPTPDPDPNPTPDPEPDPGPIRPGTEVLPEFPPAGLSWIAGADRYETAALLSSLRHEPGVDRVFIGTGENFVDLLALASLTVTNVAPVLLAKPPAELPEATAKELTRLKPRQIVVIGGPAALSDELLTELRTFVVDDRAAARAALAGVDDAAVVRLSGPDRYATVAAVATAAFDTSSTVVLATGEDFADAMVAAPLIKQFEGALLLTAPNHLPQATKDALKQLQPERLVIVGGASAVSHRVAAQAASLSNALVVRIAGTDRFETASAVASRFDAPTDVVYIAAGLAWPDALGIVPLAQESGGPLLLLAKDEIPEATDRALRRLQPTSIVVVGGLANFDAENVRALEKYLRDPERATLRSWPDGRLE